MEDLRLDSLAGVGPVTTKKSPVGGALSQPPAALTAFILLTVIREAPAIKLVTIPFSFTMLKKIYQYSLIT